MAQTFVNRLLRERTLHHWDVVGDDETSSALLGQFKLTQHAPVGPVVVADLAERLLLLWVRRPSNPGRLREPVVAARFGQLQAMRSGY